MLARSLFSFCQAPGAVCLLVTGGVGAGTGGQGTPSMRTVYSTTRCGIGDSSKGRRYSSLKMPAPDSSASNRITSVPGAPTRSVSGERYSPPMRSSATGRPPSGTDHEYPVVGFDVRRTSMVSPVARETTVPVSASVTTRVVGAEPQAVDIATSRATSTMHSAEAMRDIHTSVLPAGHRAETDSSHQYRRAAGGIGPLARAAALLTCADQCAESGHRALWESDYVWRGGCPLL